MLYWYIPECRGRYVPGRELHWTAALVCQPVLDFEDFMPPDAASCPPIERWRIRPRHQSSPPLVSSRCRARRVDNEKRTL